jgi:hypothetical protein
VISLALSNNNSSGSSNSSSSNYRSMEGVDTVFDTSSNGGGAGTSILIADTAAADIKHPIEQQPEGVPSIANNPSGISRPISRGEDSCFKDCVAICGFLAIFMTPVTIGMGVGSMYGRPGIAIGGVVGMFGGFCADAIFVYVLKKTHYNGYV